MTDKEIEDRAASMLRELVKLLREARIGRAHFHVKDVGLMSVTTYDPERPTISDEGRRVRTWWLEQ